MTLPEILERIHQRLDAIEASLSKDSRFEQRLRELEKETLEEAYRVDLPLPCDPINPEDYEERGI